MGDITGDDLIGTSTKAPFQQEMALLSWQSWDYAFLRPYPQHAFGPAQWPREKGPFPTALPYTSTIISELSAFVFQNGGPQFSVPDDPDSDALLQLLIKRNNLPSQYVPVAEDGGNQGAMAAKFSVDPNDDERPVRFAFLKIPQECRIWLDPHDKHTILMARIQYPYRDLVTGHWMYFREEWTAESWITYEPLLAGSSDLSGIGSLPGYRTHIGDTDEPSKWVIRDNVPNPLGLIPVTVLRNRASVSNPFGEGDCWRVFRLMDRIALTMHGEDKSNQLHSDPIPVATNAELDNEGALLPGEWLSVRNDNPDVKADVKLLEPTGAARAYSVAYIEKMEELLYDAVGVNQIKTKDVSNKGNLTSLALQLMNYRTISTADRKRDLYGAGGYSRLFRDVLLALQNLGGFPQVKKFRPDMEVSCEWPTYFAETPQDMKDTTDRTATQVENNFLPLPRAIERIARVERIPTNEIAIVKSEVAAQASARLAAASSTASKNGAESSAADVTGAQIAAIADASGSSNFSA